jgi:hypothetical protein
MIVGVENMEANNIDAADSMKIYFTDVLTGKLVDLITPQTRGTVAGNQLWPTSLSNVGQMIPFHPPIVKLRNNKESWKQVVGFLSTSATAGNRNHVARVFYFPRNKLRI